MSTSIERFDARQWPDDQLETLFAGAFPAFITADAVAKVYIGRVRQWFTAFNVMLVTDGCPSPPDGVCRSDGTEGSSTIR